MSDEQVGGVLIGRGSFGCVFKPALKCPGDKKLPDNIVSKIFFGKDSKQEALSELKMNAIVKKIKGNEKWAYAWYKKCKPSTYDKLYKVDSSIETCLDQSNISESDYNKYRVMLHGPDAGVSLIDFMMKRFKSHTFNNKNQFKCNFLDIVRIMKPLFLGLQSMYNNDVSHNDIKDENIMVDKDGCKYIDFGLACESSNNKYYENRSKVEFFLDRIYPSYPYEFILLYTPIDLLEDEEEDTSQKIYRSLHDRYVVVHEQLFSRNTVINIKNLLYRYMDGIKKQETIKPANRRKLLSLLDTYSLGMLLPCILCKLAKKHSKMSKLRALLRDEPMNSFMSLFKHMTEPDYFNRIYPQDAYNKYLELENLYLLPKRVKGKRSRRK